MTGTFLHYGPCSGKQCGGLRPTSLRGPVTTSTGECFHPSALPLLTRSCLLLEYLMDVIHFAKSLEERDEIEEFGV